MASSVDITPSVGHSTMCTQLGVGETPGYDAIDFRRLAQMGWQEGVNNASSYVVTTHSPNGLLLDVSPGLATVQGDSINDQSKYVVPPMGGVVSVDLAAADTVNPRVDQVILRVYDDLHDRSGSNKASVESLTGTAGAGATLDNRTGAAPLPHNSLRLADALIMPNATVVAGIRDRRRWANGANWLGSRRTGNVTTTSTSHAAIDATNLQCRLETPGNPVMISLVANATLASAQGWTGFLVDGVPPVATWHGAGVFGGTGTADWAGFTYTFIPAGGSHLYTATFAAVTAGQGFTLAADGTNAEIVFTVQEIADFSKANGTV